MATSKAAVEQISDAQKREFKELGFLVIRDGIEADLVREASDVMWDAMPHAKDDHEAILDPDTPSPSGIQDDMETNEPIAEINERLHAYGEQLVGEGTLQDPGDRTHLALRYPKGVRSNDPRAPQVSSDLNSHIDGWGNEFELDEDEVGYNTMFAIAYLDRVRPQGGGFTVWPGSHWTAGEYFQSHSLKSGKGGVPGITEEGRWDYEIKRSDQADGFELWGDAGTVILAHYKLEHSAGINLSPNVRSAAITRLSRPDGDEIKHEAAKDIWKYWPAMQEVDVYPGFEESVIEEQPSGGPTYILEQRRY